MAKKSSKRSTPSQNANGKQKRTGGGRDKRSANQFSKPAKNVPETTNRERQPRRPKPALVPEGTEVLYGKHSVRSVLLRRPNDVQKLLLAGKESYHDELVALARKTRTETFLVPWPDFLEAGKFDETIKHQGVLAYVKNREVFDEADFDRLESARCVLVLDQVSNPQNLATIIRSAAFFHADAVMYMKNRAATPTPEVVRFAVGGAEMVDMYQITNVATALDDLQDRGFNVLGLDERGKRTLAGHDLSGKTAFVIGAEGEGLRAKTKSYCTDLVRIPGGMEGVESLNAAVATTIALYEFARLSD